MESYQKKELDLREAKCGVCEDPNHWNEILARRWNDIKNDSKILEWAIQPLRYYVKSGEKKVSVESVNGVSICESILLNYEEFTGENNVYQKLINLIFSNKPHENAIAKTRDYTVLDYYYAQPFLILALQNPNLVLTEEQKGFVVCQAYYQVRDKCSIYGIEPYGLGYLILNSSRWTLEEKKLIIKCVWTNEEEFKIVVNKWKKDAREDFNSDLLAIIDEYGDKGNKLRKVGKYF